MKMIQVYVSDETHARLTMVAAEKGRRIEELAECSVAEEALQYFRHRKDDPANSLKPNTA